MRLPVRRIEGAALGHIQADANSHERRRSHRIVENGVQRPLAPSGIRSNSELLITNWVGAILGLLAPCQRGSFEFQDIFYSERRSSAPCSAT